MAYGSFGGPLPFSGGGRDYASAYQSALAFNNANYNQILSGYQQTLANQQAAQAGLQSGYNQLQGSVLGGLAGIDRSQRQANQDMYAKQVGLASQQMIDRGLGNSTVQQAVARGLMFDKMKADAVVANNTQNLTAQYASQLGLAGLAAQGRAIDQNTGLAQSQLAWLNSINAAYPDPRTYAALAQMKGQSAMGGYVGGGGTSYGGQVKSPLGAGMMTTPNNSGWTTYGSGFGWGGATAAKAGGLYPEADSWPNTPYGGMQYDFPQADMSMGGNAGGGGFYDPWAEEPANPYEAAAPYTGAPYTPQGDGYDGSEWSYY